MGLANRLAKLEKKNPPDAGRVVIYDVHAVLQEYHLGRCLDALRLAVPTAEALDELWQRIVKGTTTDEDNAVFDAIPRDALSGLDQALLPRDPAKFIARICELWCAITVH